MCWLQNQLNTDSYIQHSFVFSAYVYQLLRTVLHYFLGCWMLVEGLNLQMKTSNKTLQYFGTYHKHIVWLNYCIGWLLPFLIVMVSACTGFLTDAYMQRKSFKTPLLPTETYEICWLDTGSNMRLYAAVIPIGITMLLNAIFVLRSAIFVIRIKRKDFERSNSIKKRHLRNSSFSQLLHGLKVVLLLAPVTGIP